MQKKIILFIICIILFEAFCFSQVTRPTRTLPDDKLILRDTLRNRDIENGVGLNKKAKISDYLIIDHKNDTTFVDTTLTLKKLYKFNYLRKDNFHLLPFSNLGQTYNNLSYPFEANSNTIPKFGARARHFNYFEIDDINYYHVPTPLTELFFKTAFEQGQLLDAFFTINTSPQFNFSVAYKGLRSLGKYQNILTSTGNFRVTTKYNTKDLRYKFRGHIVTQDLLNNENGGLSDDDIINFESGDEEFLDRSVFDPNFENAKNILVGKRFHLEHEYQLVKARDSINTSVITLGNVLSFEDKFYRLEQTAATPEVLGDAFRSPIYDKVTLEDFFARGFVQFNLNDFGTVQASADYININYGYNTLININGETIINRIKEDFFRFGGDYVNTIGGFKLKGGFLVNLSDQITGYSFNADAGYSFNDSNSVSFFVNLNNSLPNYNYLLYQSDYINYNWDNTESFSNETKKSFQFRLQSESIADISADYTSISNFTYFTDDMNLGVKPMQANDEVNYFRIKAGKELLFGNFGLDNTVMYQHVLEGESVLNIPKFITRNSFYYQNDLFKKALFLQTGITFKYFTSYNMNAYDPVLAEFYVQNENGYGGFPLMDFFVNAKVRQTRIFFIAEHFNSSFTGYNFYSAPNYPYRDFSIRFGIVWNFFL